MKKTYETVSTKRGVLKTRLEKDAASITSIKKSLSEQEKQLELIINHIPALISYVDATEHYRFCNKLYEEWLGNTGEYLYGKTMRQVRGEAVYKEIRPYIKKALAGKQVTYDSTLEKQDGSLLYFTATYAPHFDTSGKVQGFFILATDVTQRKLAEQRLLEREAQFRLLIEANVIGVIIKSLDGPIIEANDIFLKMVGYTKSDLHAGKVNWLTMTPPEPLKNRNVYEKELVTKGAVKPVEKEYIRKDGTRVPVLIGDVLLDKKQRTAITFILDITKQKELDKRKDEFIALASHELKTPLTSLKMYGQLIERFSKDTLSEKSAQLFSSMDKQIDKLTELVNDLLDVSRIQSGKLQYKKETFAIDKLIKETVEDMQRLSKKHTLIMHGHTKQLVRADRERLKQVLTNLLTNAIKYSPKSDKINIGLDTKDNEVKISVQDFGVGIPLRQKDKIFDRFFQVERPLSQTYPGLGLGLFITKEIIDRHKGKIWVESEKGGGTTFYFTIPLGKVSKVAKNA